MNWLKKIWKAFSEPVPPYKSASGATTSSKARPFKPTQTDEDYSNFTPRAQQLLTLSRQEAERLNHNFVGTEHVLLGLIALGQGVAARVLGKQGLDLKSLRTQIELHVGWGPDQKIIGHIPYTPRVKKVLTLADKERRALNHTYLGTEHILLGLLREGDGVAGRVLKSRDVNIEQTRVEILRELDPNFTTHQNPGEPSNARIAEATTTQSEPPRTTTPQIEGIDLTKRYDVYCAERYEEVVVYRNVLFKGVKKLFRGDNDELVDFIELEQVDGQPVFVAKYSVIKFCGPGGTPNAENVPGKQP